ncbi:MAG TPA: hypothetical protein VJU86_16095 [Pyrinomonadaceae bacterium]|nr:hypothetical protein [Pyrinomonadaceae bacterium]
MTPDEQTYDRFGADRALALPSLVSSLRESRIHTLRLEAYVAKLPEYDAAKLAAAKMPEDVKTREYFRLATEELNQARESLQRANEHRPGHSSRRD